MRAQFAGSRVSDGKRLSRGFLISLPLLQIESSARQSLFVEVDENQPELSPETPELHVLLQNERNLLDLTTDVVRMLDLVLTGARDVGASPSAFKPIQWFIQMDEEIRALIEKARRGESLGERFENLSQEESRAQWNAYVEELTLQFISCREVVMPLSHGTPLTHRTCFLLLGCMQSHLRRFGPHAEVPSDWNDCFLLLAQQVNRYIAEDLVGTRSLLKRSFEKLATFRKGRVHWSDERASPEARKESALALDLAGEALRSILDYIHEKKTPESLLKLQADCTNFLGDITSEHLRGASVNTRLAHGEDVTAFATGLSAAIEGGISVKEFSRDFFRTHERNLIARREIEVFGCNFGHLEEALVLCSDVLKDHEIASKRHERLKKDLDAFILIYASFLCGFVVPVKTSPEEFRQSAFKLLKKIEACHRLDIRQRMMAVEGGSDGRREGGASGRGAGSFRAGIGGRGLKRALGAPSTLTSLSSLRSYDLAQVVGDPPFIIAQPFSGSSETINELLDSEDPAVRSSVRSGEYLSHLVCQFTHWTRSCVLDGAGQITKTQVVQNHSQALARKWEYVGRDDYAALLQDLVTDMATLLPNLLAEGKSELLLSLQPWSPMSLYSDCAKVMTTAGRAIIQHWRDHVQEIDAQIIFREVTMRILSDDRTPAHLKLAQIVRLWRIIEMCGSLIKYPQTGESWLQAWEEMEVVEYALFENARNFTPNILSEGLRIVQRLL